MKKFKKNVWVAIPLILAVIFIGAGFYLNTEPEWTKRTFPDYYNQGVSDYSEGKNDQAYNQFSYIASVVEDSKLKSLALYNAGTMLAEMAVDERFSAQSRFQIAQSAIRNLEEAVWSDPDNQDAKYNLEFIKNKLPEIFTQMIQETQGEDQPTHGPGYSPGGNQKGY